MGGKIHPLKYSFKLSLGASALIFVTLESSKQDDTSGYRPTNPGITAALVFDKKKNPSPCYDKSTGPIKKAFPKKKKKKKAFPKEITVLVYPPPHPAFLYLFMSWNNAGPIGTWIN